MSRFKSVLWAVPVLLLSIGVMAAEPAASAAPSTAAAPAPAVSTLPSASGAMSSGIGGQLLQLLLGLGLVVGLIFVLAWLMRRVQRSGPAGNQVIELLGSRALGPRDRLVLVQVGNEQILLGVTPGRITPLHVMNEPVHVPQTQSTTPEFARRLMEALGNKGGSDKGATHKGSGTQS
ncbi:flagellar biosynthetic protein FliO [Pseudomonas huanghezhanensis]|uniref:flagellar biosynthetic protein FliO n=1 Tax=Pseudomonas huanghezhanensis TaxID=3002903 RepID=UPI0022860383|nr:flagellar biosynthetic protein FliO [Pseudomonas sp. BSw22131]